MALTVVRTQGQLRPFFYALGETEERLDYKGGGFRPYVIFIKEYVKKLYRPWNV